MKIIFINRYFYPDHSATSQILTDLAFFLAGQGREVHIITSRQRYDDPAARLAAVDVVGQVQVHRVWTSRFGRAGLLGRTFDYLSFYLSAGWRAWRLSRRDDLLVSKTDPPLASMLGAWVARRRGARLVNWLQDLFPEVAVALNVRGMAGRVGQFLQRRRNASLHTAAINVVIGERMAQRLRAEGIPERQLCVIHNWADGDAIQPVAAATNPLRREWGLEGRFVIGYSGNMGRAHEFETLLNAMASLSIEQNPLAPPIVFLFIGGGHQREHLQAEAQRRGITNVQFRAYQPRERLRESLGVADVHVISLRPELEGIDRAE
ncbi:MAG: glycosyltransferase family 4 protein [Gammaproteobacteria bacterium]